MAQEFLNVNGEGLSGSNRKFPMIKTYSFTTDEDDTGSTMNGKSTPMGSRVSLLKSASVDSLSIINDDDPSEKENKLLRRKSRRQTEIENSNRNKRSSRKPTPWYRKVDVSKPLKIIGLIILIYFMWVERNVWGPRLLTSNTRIHRTDIGKNDQESADSSSHTTIISSDSPDHEDNIEDGDEKNDLNDNHENLISSSPSPSSSSSSSSKSTNSQKPNLRTRRNRLSFSQDRQKKKHRSSLDSSIDGDNSDDNEGEEQDKLNEIKQPIESLKINSIQTNKSEILIPLKSSLSLSTYDNVLEQIRKNLKSRSRNQEFMSTLTKKTGLDKNKLYRFIYKKEYELVTLQTFMIILDKFNLMLLIVPK